MYEGFPEPNLRGLGVHERGVGASPVKRNIPISPGSQEPDFTAKGDFAAKAISLVGTADEFHCGISRSGWGLPRSERSARI